MMVGLVREPIFGLLVTPEYAEFMSNFQDEYMKVIVNKPVLTKSVDVKVLGEDGPARKRQRPNPTCL